MLKPLIKGFWLSKLYFVYLIIIKKIKVMELKEILIQETKILNELGDLVIKYDDLKRRGLMTWVEFKRQAHKINSKSVMYVEEYFDGFLEDNKHNSLPYSSSGSFLTAITDHEYFYENELFEDLDDSEIDEIVNNYLLVF